MRYGTCELKSKMRCANVVREPINPRAIGSRLKGGQMRIQSEFDRSAEKVCVNEKGFRSLRETVQVFVNVAERRPFRLTPWRWITVTGLACFAAGCVSVVTPVSGCSGTTCPDYSALSHTLDWNQENLKRNDSGCPTAIFDAPSGVLHQCE